MNLSTSDPNSPAEEPPKRTAFPRFLKPRRDKILPAFWTVASVISMVVNIFLIALVILLGGQLFTLKHMISDQLLGGLYNNFVLMDQARIQTTIPVQTNVAAKFNLQLKTNTQVTLTQDTLIPRAHIANLNAGALTISNATLDIRLPKGTKLPVHLELTVPVDKKIPVNLDVAVDIPLNQTDLHVPFVGLQQVVGPYYQSLNGLPDSWQKLLCGSKPGSLCQMLFP
jgi:hypothetical protein